MLGFNRLAVLEHLTKAHQSVVKEQVLAHGLVDVAAADHLGMNARATKFKRSESPTRMQDGSGQAIVIPLARSSGSGWQGEPSLAVLQTLHSCTTVCSENSASGPVVLVRERNTSGTPIITCR